MPEQTSQRAPQTRPSGARSARGARAEATVPQLTANAAGARRKRWPMAVFNEGT